MNQDNLASLKERLREAKWPQLYMYKFIIPNVPEKYEALGQLFGDTASISIRESGKGKYLSYTAKEMVLTADDVISKYEEAMKIEGVMAL